MARRDGRDKFVPTHILSAALLDWLLSTRLLSDGAGHYVETEGTAWVGLDQYFHVGTPVHVEYNFSYYTVSVANRLEEVLFPARFLDTMEALEVEPEQPEPVEVRELSLPTFFLTRFSIISVICFNYDKLLVFSDRTVQMMPVLNKPDDDVLNAMQDYLDNVLTGVTPRRIEDVEEYATEPEHRWLELALAIREVAGYGNN